MKNPFLILVIISLTNPAITYGQHVTTWRGPNQGGVYPDTNLLDAWPATGPDILWTFENLGAGYSSPAMTNDRIYVSGMEGSTGYVYALSQQGKLLWKAPYGKEFSTSYPGSRGTPVIAGELLYMLGGLGDLVCLDARTGASIWHKNVFNDFGGRQIEWGLNETVVIHEDKLICTPGGTSNNVIALDRLSGKLIWSSRGKGEKSAYCTPLLVTVGPRHLLVTHTEDHILGMDADNGKLLWDYPHTNIYSIHPNTPLYHNNMVFCFSGYGQGGVMLQLNSDGSRITRKWISKTMDSRIGGAVFLNGKIYGSGDKSREWQCIDWESGQEDYTTKEIGNGTIIAADGKLYLYSQRGELALVKPGTSSFEILSETRVRIGSDQHWAHPVIDNGRLFIRHGKALIVYKVKR